MVIGSQAIADWSRCFVIAEAGVNHNGDIGRARELVEVAADAKADAVKFQTFRTRSLVTAQAETAEYQRAATAEKTQTEMLRKLELRDEDFAELAALARARGIIFLSTAFDLESLDLLDSLGVPAFKVPSGELTNHPFLEAIARKGKPMLVSTGMAEMREVEDALSVINAAENGDVALLHCVSEYPAAPESANLRAMETMRKAFGVPVGYSDHTLGLDVALAAAALGAAVLEKHFTLDRALPGPDHAASLEPPELSDLVQSVRTIQSALGTGIKTPTAGERKVAAAARRSLVVGRDVEAGEELTSDVLTLLRPGTGLPPSAASSVIGRRARVRIQAGTVLSLDMLA